MLKTVLIYIFLLIISFTKADEGLIFATAGKFFQQKLVKENYFPGAVNVQFSFSVGNLPDNPSWVALEQQDANSEAFIYGRPIAEGGTKLEIIALNKDTYETSRKEIIISVKNTAKTLSHMLRFKVKGEEVDQLLLASDKFVDSVRQIWPYVERIVSIKASTEGVFVVVSSEVEVPQIFKSVINYCQQPSQHLIDAFAKNNFQIDWCQLQLFNFEANKRQQFNTADNFRNISSPYEATLYNNNREELHLMFIAIPIVLGLAMFFALTTIMCCGGSGLRYTPPVNARKPFNEYNTLPLYQPPPPVAKNADSAF